VLAEVFNDDGLGAVELDAHVLAADGQQVFFHARCAVKRLFGVFFADRPRHRVQPEGA
jgi:hypothetical protein